MGFSVKFYLLLKKKNSTLQPPTTAQIQLTCELKADSDILNPSILVNSTNANLLKMNYCYIAQFSRYYYITNWTWEKGLWRADLSVDVLATYKTQIGATSTYILRSSYASDGTTKRYNGNIMDSIYPATSDISTSRVYASHVSGSTWTSNLESGYYVVGIINGSNADAGAVSYYVFAPANFKAFCYSLFSSPTWLSITDISEGLQRALMNPFQYVASVKWFPFQPPVKAATSTISLGWWSFTGGSVNPLNLTDVASTPLVYSFAVPKHPDASSRGEYLNLSPYSRYSMIIPFVGTIPIDSALLDGMSTIYISYRVDSITGDCRVSVYTNTTPAREIITRYCNVGVDIQLAQIATDYLGTASTAVSAATSAVGSALSGNIAGAITSVASGISNTISSAMPQMETSGSNGSVGFMSDLPSLQAVFYRPAAEDYSDIGRPYCQTVSINTLSGYLLCRDGHFAGNSLEPETMEINNYMTSGLYYE